MKKLVELYDLGKFAVMVIIVAIECKWRKHVEKRKRRNGSRRSSNGWM